MGRTDLPAATVNAFFESFALVYAVKARAALRGCFVKDPSDFVEKRRADVVLLARLSFPFAYW
jgi:hypothetical protein